MECGGGSIVAHDKTRDRILDEAERVFADVGFAGARTQTIAQSAGVTPAMIHYYFATKQGLFDAVLDRVVDELLEILDGIQPSAMSFSDALDAFLDAYFDYVFRHPNFARLTRMAVGNQPLSHLEHVIQKHFRPLFQAGVDFVQAGIDAGEFLPANPRQVVLSFYCMTVYYFSDAPLLGILLDRDPLSSGAIEERRTALRELVFRGLGVLPPPGATTRQ